MAGALLFAHRPQRWHPRCGIRVVKWEGTERRTGAQLNVVKDRTLEAPLPKLLDEAFEFVGTLLRDFGEGIDRMFREMAEELESLDKAMAQRGGELKQRQQPHSPR